MDNVKYTWEFGLCHAVNVYKEDRTSAVVVVSAEYDDKLRFRIIKSKTSIITDWDQVIVCLAEAKSVLKKIKKI